MFSQLNQEAYKATKYQVSPDMQHVLLAFGVTPVSAIFCHATVWASSYHMFSVLILRLNTMSNNVRQLPFSTDEN